MHVTESSLDFQKKLHECMQLTSSGKHEEAKKLALEILKLVSDAPEAKYIAALVFFNAKEFQKAYKYIKSAIEDNNNPQFRNIMGVVLLELKRFDEAIPYLQEAVANNPNNVSCYLNLANLYNQMNMYSEEKIVLNKAISIFPNNTKLYEKLGDSFADTKELEKSLVCYKKIYAMQPSEDIYLSNIVKILLHLQKSDEAIEYCDKAIELFPDNYVAYNRKALIYQSKNEFDKAIENFAKARSLAAGSNFLPVIQKNICICLYNAGYYTQVIKEYELLLKMDPKDEYLVASKLLFPAVMESNEAIDESRKLFEENLKRLESLNIHIKNPEQSIPMPFYHLYHGRNNKQMLVKMAKFFQKICPELNYVADHCKKKAKSGIKNRKIRFGYVSLFAYNTKIGKAMYAPFLDMAKGEDFEVFFFTNSHDDIDLLTDVKITDLPKNLQKAQKLIASHELDIIYYDSLGIESLMYFLSFSRLAKIQCTSTGHPITSGVPTVDYYISYDLMEGKNAQTHYSETLFKLKNHWPDFSHLKCNISDKRMKNKEELGMSDKCTSYVCPMLLHKLHPDFDKALSQILHKDPKAEIILFKNSEGKYRIYEKTIERMKRTMPEVIDRVKFIPHAEKDDFLNILEVADAILDTFPFGGGATPCMLTSLGIPMVTLPGEFLYERITYSMYKKMKIMDTVAKDIDDYVEKAITLANNKKLRNQISKKILDNNDKVFDNKKGAKELIEFFRNAVKNN